MSVQKKLYKFRDGVERKYGEDYSALPVKNRTDLYRQVRSASFQTKTTWYSGNPGGLDIWQTSQMAERVANVYDIQGFDSWEEINYNRYVGTEDFKNNFDVRSTPIIFATSTGVYGSHQIAVFVLIGPGRPVALHGDGDGHRSFRKYVYPGGDRK